jgi:aldehyde:ferredoxin oxidoreductase
MPLLLLSIAEGAAWGDRVTVPFLYDVEMNVRLLLALPLLVVAELVVNQRLRPTERQFVERFLRLRDRYPNPFRAVDPLAPENPLIISTSPPNGTTVPTSARFHANFKSPLTGGIGSTNSGGRWGIEFKRTGHDAMVVIGRWSRSSARWPVAKGRSAARSHRGRSAWPNATATRTRRWP